ncbi:solute carrier family 2, facilitated glucose transporter member 10 [Trichomycterus rosablanca]|uniref:solute carrier family 2, facilitated glucose transporter member 10 n=1 Tax=Trichomycterus rosablanca TaxID=2290929 RepID=UPI002F350F2C
MGRSAVVLAAAVATLGGLVFGYELGVVSGALLQLQLRFNLSCVRQEVVVSALLVGAILASAIGGWLIDRRGRRTSVLLSNLLTVSGSLTLSFSRSFWTLVLGRVIAGLAVSVSSMSCCILVSETVRAERRGLMVTLYEVGVTGGILLAYAANLALSGAQDGWRFMFGLVMAPALAQSLAVWALPPQQVAPDRFPGGDGAQGQSGSCSALNLFGREENMRSRMLIGLGLVLFQQFTGQPNVLLYASTVFQNVGFKSDAAAVWASLGLGLVKAVATLVATFCADKVGRRPLLIGGCSVMAVGLVLLGFLSGRTEFGTAGHCDSRRSAALSTGNATVAAGGSDELGASHWMILLCMMSVVAAFSVGFGPMTWVVLSEIFPAEVRGRAFAFSSCCNWVANLIITFTFLNVIDLMGLSGTFFVYGATAVAAAVFVHLLLPETKNKTLQEIDQELRQRRIPGREDWCSIFQRRNFSPGYQRLSWTNSAI